MPDLDRPSPNLPGEFYTRDGRLRITPRRLMALNALCDTPDGRTQTITEWQGLVRRYGEFLHHDTVWSIPKSWVQMVPLGRRWGAVLNDRGRAILAGLVPMYVQGHGPVGSVREWLGRTNQTRRGR